MTSKIDQFRDTPVFLALPPSERQALETIAYVLRLSHQQIRQLILIARDLQMWQAGSVAEWYREIPDANRGSGKQRAARISRQLAERWETEKWKGPRYDAPPPPVVAHKQQIIEIEAPATILGPCPVASEKTRCCNLLTLDAAVNCGYGCAYCTIQSFYDEGRIFMHPDLGKRLRELDLDPDQIYHIGTGQSSDSLMWGNRNGLLEELSSFSRAHPNVILELKTKSANVAWLIENPPPPNVLVTWTLNSDEMIEHEEHGTATLDQRLDAASAAAAAGILVGFHFHPMVPHHRWRNSYGTLFSRLLSRFDPTQVALVSFGTLTFIKPVVNAIRERGQSTQVLRMPMTETAGKLSYPPK